MDRKPILLLLVITAVVTQLLADFTEEEERILQLQALTDFKIQQTRERIQQTRKGALEKEFAKLEEQNEPNKFLIYDSKDERLKISGKSEIIKTPKERLTVRYFETRDQFISEIANTADELSNNQKRSKAKPRIYQYGKYLVEINPKSLYATTVGFFTKKEGRDQNDDECDMILREAIESRERDSESYTSMESNASLHNVMHLIQTLHIVDQNVNDGLRKYQYNVLSNSPNKLEKPIQAITETQITAAIAQDNTGKYYACKALPKIQKARSFQEHGNVYL